MRFQQGRRKIVWGGVACGLAMALTSASSAFAKEYIVKFKDPAGLRQFEHAKFLSGAKLLDTHSVGGLAKIDLEATKSSSLAERLAQLMSRDDVEYVTENFTLQSFVTPNDPQFAEQWSLAKVRAATAWDKQVGSHNVVVAVIDTGVDYNHPDLTANIWNNTSEVAGNDKDDDGNGLVDDVHGWDFLDNDADPMDATSAQNPGHGTHCAGIIGAVGDNNTGISGISQKVSIIPLRFIGPNGQGDLMAAIKSIDYAIAAKASIISASWGARVAAAQAQPLIDAISRANDAGVIFVAAAANDGANNDTTEMYPANANFPNVISVAASDRNDAKPQWSNYGKAKVALAAPGHEIISTLPATKYGSLSGTSMATPLVAGLVALLQSQGSRSGEGLTGPQMRALLQTSGARVDIETACMCRIDATAAMDTLTADRLFVVPAAGTFAPNDTGKFSAVGGAGGYKFASSNPSVLEVAADGTMTAKAEGETTVKVTDAAGATADSLSLFVKTASSTPPPSGDCPLGDPALCAALCQILPSLPWCK